MLQDFLQASNTLKTTFETSPTSASSDLMLQSALMEIDKNLSSVASLRGPLNTVHFTLAGMRNKSRELVPISSLPSELLGYIFTLLPCHCLHDTPLPAKDLRKYPDVLLEVSTHWRRVALATRSLWSHIDILPCGPHSTRFYSMAYDSLQRADGAPLHIHITHEKPASRSQVLRMLDLILPFAPQFRSLELVSSQDGSWLYGAVLAGCVGSSSPGCIRSVALTKRSPSRVNLTRETWGALFLQHSWEDLDARLQSMHTLHLDGVSIGLSSKAYAGLTNLQFGFEQPITKAQIAEVLSANPALSALKIRLLAIVPTGEQFDLITLNHLKLLSVTGVNDHTLGHVLSLLAPGPEELAVCIVDCVNAKNSEPVQSFFSRSNISTLCMNAPGLQRELVLRLLPRALFGSLPRLHTLVLQDAWIGDGYAGADQYKTRFSHMTASPKLRRLCLNNCWLDPTFIRHSLPAQHVEVLSVWHCLSTTGEITHGINKTTALIEKLRRSLLGVVSRVERGTDDPILRWLYSR